MPRPKQYVEYIVVRFRAGTLERIRAIAGGERQVAVFAREATEKELARRERAKRRQAKKEDADEQ